MHRGPRLGITIDDATPAAPTAGFLKSSDLVEVFGAVDRPDVKKNDLGLRGIAASV